MNWGKKFESFGVNYQECIIKNHTSHATGLNCQEMIVEFNMAIEEASKIVLKNCEYTVIETAFKKISGLTLNTLDNSQVFWFILTPINYFRDLIIVWKVEENDSVMHFCFTGKDFLNSFRVVHPYDHRVKQGHRKKIEEYVKKNNNSNWNNRLC